MTGIRHTVAVENTYDSANSHAFNVQPPPQLSDHCYTYAYSC